jgi:hypothetical protein
MNAIVKPTPIEAARREREIEDALQMARSMPASVAGLCVASPFRALEFVRRSLELARYVEDGTISRDEFHEDILDLAREERRQFADAFLGYRSRA